MAERIRIDHGNFESARARVRAWRVPDAVKREVHHFLDDLALGKVNRGKRISPSRQLKYLHALKAPLEFLNKSTARLTVRDIENLERALVAGRLANHFTGKPFAHSTQVDMRMLLKIFLRWQLGAARAEELAGWLDTRPRAKTPDYLKEAEVECLYSYCRTAAQRFLIAVLFDSGARAEEFHNIRFEDIQMSERQDNFVRIALKQEYSKTQGRTVALYWKPSMVAVTKFLSERIAAGIKPSEPVFQGSYDATKKFLQRLGLRVLKRRVHYHLFRHSSATYYASRLNRQELCLRYGWKFSSNMPDVYISRSGMDSKALDEKFTQTRLGTVEAELVQMEQASRIKDDRIRQLEDSVRAADEKFTVVFEVLRVTSNDTAIREALERKRWKQNPQTGQLNSMSRK
jgi:integrase